MAEGFLGRWSQRKLAVKAGQQPPEPERAPPQDPTSASKAPTSASKAPTSGAAVPEPAGPAQTPPVSANAAEQAPAPTLEEAQALTPASDFSRFVAPKVPAQVRNAALKKLFADPHFNVMDGLDIYIDDYSKPDPLPAAQLRQLVSAQFMKLVDPEPESAAPTPTPPKPPAAVRAETPPASDPAQTPDAASDPPGPMREVAPAPTAAQTASNDYNPNPPL
ncbi:MAG: DUF3306 domain-containing protein [Rhodoferax sp.]